MFFTMRGFTFDTYFLDARSFEPQNLQMIKMTLAMSLGLAVGMLSSCTHKWDSAENTAFFGRSPAQAGHSARNGEWTPLVHLKDVTNTYGSKPMRPRPPGGWWVTPDSCESDV
jgi:hypothetical protein